MTFIPQKLVLGLVAIIFLFQLTSVQAVRDVDVDISTKDLKDFVICDKIYNRYWHAVERVASNPTNLTNAEIQAYLTVVANDYLTPNFTLSFPKYKMYFTGREAFVNTGITLFNSKSSTLVGEMHVAGVQDRTILPNGDISITANHIVAGRFITAPGADRTEYSTQTTATITPGRRNHVFTKIGGKWYLKSVSIELRGSLAILKNWNYWSAISLPSAGY